MINVVERIGVYGGTFAPIHNGHIAAAKAFLEQMKLDKVLIVPTYIPPHKKINIADDPKHRLNMCNIAFENDDRIEVSDIEISRGGCSYTIDTLRSLQSEQRKLFLLCGTDMMLTFDKWKDAEQIFKICCPIYIRRESDFSLNDKIISKNNEYYQKYGVAFRRIVSDPIEISSSEIRDMIKNKEEVLSFVPISVIDYIKSNNLYVS